MLTKPKLQEWHDMLDYVVMDVLNPDCEIIGLPLLTNRHSDRLECVGFDVDRVVMVDGCGYATSVKPWGIMGPDERRDWTQIVDSLLDRNEDVTDDWTEAKIGRVA